MNIKVEFRGEKVIVYTDKNMYEDMLGNISCMIAEGNWKTLTGFLDVQRNFEKLQAYAINFLDKCFYSKEKLAKVNGYMLCDSELELNQKKYTSYKNVSGKMIDGKIEMVVSDTYLIQSVTELINLEMMYAVINDIPITKCRNCNRYFVATNSGVYYCDRVFNANRTCRQIGAKKLFNDNLKTDKAFLLYEKTYQASQALRKYNSAIVFLKNQDIVYAIHNKTKSNCNGYTNEIEYSSEFKIYSKKTSDKKFKIDKSSMDTEFLKMFLTAGYQQRQLFDYSRNPNKILDIVDDFINWKHHKNYQSILGQLENRYSRLEELLNNIRKNHSATGSKFVEYIDNHGQVSEINNIINIINTKKEELHNLRVKMIDELNKVLLGKVKLSLSKRTSTFADKKQIENLCGRAKNMQGKTYEYFLKLKKILEKIYVLSEYEDSFVFYSMLLDSNFSNIIERYKLSDIEEEDLMAIRKVLDEDDVLVFLDDQLKMEYNINAGTGFDENFKDNSMISMGQNAVALLLLILNAAYNMDDNRPLLMDQPEDDLDNSYIYSTLVKEFRNSKTKRQVIISTHNPNIPVAADAETIMVLEFDGEHGYLENVGSIDSSKTANKVLSIMEGGQEAIRRRVDKYNL